MAEASVDAVTAPAAGGAVNGVETANATAETTQASSESTLR